VALLVFGLEPAFQLTRDRDLRPEMGTTSGTVGAPKAKRQRSLVRWQVAISTGFFILAALCVRYTIAEARHDSGIDLDRLSLATMNFWRQQWNDERASRVAGRLLDELKDDPLVESVAISTGVPFGSSGTQSFSFSTTDKPITEHGTFWRGPGIAATPQIFRTLGIRILRGRSFDDRDHAGAPPVVVVSEQTAKNLFGTADVVGREMLLKPRQPVQQKRSVAGKLALPVAPQHATNSDVRTAKIVGVAADTDIGSLFSRLGVVVYMPLDQRIGAMTFAIALVRSSSSPSVAVRALREAVVRTDYDLAIESSGTGIGVLGGPTPFLRAGTAFALSLGAITLLLSMVGLYGVQSHGVERRTREIGVRMSFGATSEQIRALVLRDGYGPVLQGVAIGIFIGFLGRGLVRAFLWEKIELVDPWMVLAVPVPMILAAFFACYWPARRASRVDPNVALRHL
jgi:ABC-type antimicrobial peptide transport system permease subunit